jgi:hypothetical protein
MTPQGAYREHILMVLDHLGGSGTRKAVLAGVLDQMDIIFDDDDWEAPASRPFEARWRNMTSWERADMVRDGLLRDDSERGLWELTDDGRRAAASMTITPTGEAPTADPAPAGAGYASSSEDRAAIEWHAMYAARDDLVAEGWVVEFVHLRRLGFDLLAKRDRAELHVEVKGTTSSGADVEVTIGEVRHARALSAKPGDKTPVLIVVSDIKLESTSPPQTSGGIVTRIEPWNPTDDSLTATRFRHSVG